MTPFGNKLKAHRKARNLILGDLADKISVSVSFLSQVETGTKRIPDGMVDRIADVLQLNEQERSDILAAAAISQPKVEIKLAVNAAEFDRKLASTFANSFARLSDGEKKALFEVLKDK
ncbi:helix-turn-helix domain-containing protein [Blastomonas sp. AAP25]|uniref:helix-turn-helix domain-containing protein n=1 Tax=Blastomonas sp. AAP25 TaxID=1523416 RepID=UPI000AB33874|nr:helix-turn-helix transcriptional regulator [Blastomonas sp. AAP25]